MTSFEFIGTIEKKFQKAKIGITDIGFTVDSNKVFVTIFNTKNCQAEKCIKKFLAPFSQDDVTNATDFIMTYLTHKQTKSSFR